MRETLKNLEPLITLLKLEISNYEDNIQKQKKLESDKLTLVDVIRPFNYFDQNDELNYSSIYEELSFLDVTKLASIFDFCKNISSSTNLDLTLNKVTNYSGFIEEVLAELYHLKNNYENNDINKEYSGVKSSERKIDKFQKIVNECKIILDSQQKFLIGKNSILEDDYNMYKSIIVFFERNYYLNFDMHLAIKNMFERLNIDEKTQIEWLEAIKNYDIEIHLNSKNRSNLINNENVNELDSRKDEIVNMIDFGFENISEVYYTGTRKNELDSLIDFIYKENINDIIDFLPKYNTNFIFDNNYTLIEYNYVYAAVERKLQKDLLDNVNEMKKRSNYDDRDLRELLKRDFYKILDKYLTIRNTFLEENQKYNEDLIKKSEEENLYKLNYAVSDMNTKKTYVEIDIKTIPKDLYTVVLDMLIDLKANGFSSRYPIRKIEDAGGLLEIKNDQIRVFFCLNENSEYVILGLFQKKADKKNFALSQVIRRDRNMYIPCDDYEKELFDRLEATSFKGGRYNSGKEKK